MIRYAALVAVVFGINLLPAFGPPTWAVLVLFRFRSDLDPIALVALGATSAASGRFVLAVATRHVRGRLSARRKRNLDAAKTRLSTHRGSTLVGVGLFALSPVPSAQLFEAAGLLDVALAPLVASFFLGRIVSYSLYMSGASALRTSSLGDLFTESLTSPWGVGVQVLLLGGLVALGRIDWAKRLAEHHRS